MSYAVADIYRDLRTQALHTTAASLGITADPVGVIMETGYPEAVATLVAFADGSTSLYFSNGGGMIGAGQHEQVAETAKRLVASAASSLGELTATESFPLPRAGHTRFFVMTGSGVRTAYALEDDLGERRHPLSPLFYAAQDLITGIRRVQEA